MVSDLESRQIVALARDGMSSGDIAKELSKDEALVKLVLNTNEAGSAQDRDINDDELASLRRNAYNLAIGAEDESVQARLTMFLLERDRPPKVANQSQGNAIGNINNAVILAQRGFNDLLKEYTE